MSPAVAKTGDVGEQRLVVRAILRSRASKTAHVSAFYSAVMVPLSVESLQEAQSGVMRGVYWWSAHADYQEGYASGVLGPRCDGCWGTPG